MKTRNFLIPTLILALLASPLAAFASGGVDGGGGGTLPASPATKYQIHQIVKNAKRELRLFARYVSLYRADSDEALKKLFDGERTIYDVIEETDIDLRMEQACLDRYGVEFDGSIYSDIPGAICISAHRIAPKLDEQLARVQTLGLIWHELSHLLGTTEEEAKELQRDLVYFLKRTDEDTAYKLSFELHYGTIPRAQLAKRAVQLEIEAPSTDSHLQEKMRELVVQFNKMEIESIATVQGFSAFRGIEREYSSYLSHRLHVALSYSMTRSGSTTAANVLQVQFGDATVLPYREFYQRNYGSDYRRPADDRNDLLGNLTVSRPQSTSDISALLIEVGSFLRHHHSVTLALFSSSGFVPLDLPGLTQELVNPWSKFIGHYKVTDRACLGSNPPTVGSDLGFEISEGAQATRGMRFKVLIQNGSGENSLEPAAYIGSGSRFDLAGNDTFAQFTKTEGDLWGERWSQSSYRLEKSENGAYKMIRKGSWKSGNYPTPRYSAFTCEYTLEKL